MYQNKYITLAKDCSSSSTILDSRNIGAPAIALGCPIWSNEKRLKNQSLVEVLATHELKVLI